MTAVFPWLNSVYHIINTSGLDNFKSVFICHHQRDISSLYIKTLKAIELWHPPSHSKPYSSNSYTTILLYIYIYNSEKNHLCGVYHRSCWLFKGGLCVYNTQPKFTWWWNSTSWAALQHHNLKLIKTFKVTTKD